MGRLILERDWSGTPLGPISSWPPTLRTLVSMCLTTRFPMFIYWGPERVQLYNDAGIPIMGAKHPDHALGPLRDVFPELWPHLRPMFDALERTKQANWAESQSLPIQRGGFAEEAYFTWSYTPVLDDDGAVVGFYTPAMETTGQVLGQRRLRTLHLLTQRAGGTGSVEEACRAGLDALAENPADLPFTWLYVTDADGARASLVGSTGMGARSAAVPAHLDLRAQGDGGPAGGLLAPVAATRQAARVEDVNGWLDAPLPPEAAEPPRPALVLPLPHAEGDRDLGFLVVGLSPFLNPDGEYRGFLELVAGALATAASSARARQEAVERMERLAALDRAKTAFFSNVSHEFRTPLTLMLGPVEDALSDTAEPLPPRQAERLSLVQRNATRLLKLVNTLLDFTRAEAGRVRAAFQPTDLSAFTAELVSQFESIAKRAQLTLTLDLPPLAEPVWVDREMWEKVVFNLLSNAMKFTFEGGVHVQLRGEDGQARLAVRDTGSGIPEAELPHIFERFHRVENARSRSHEGSGIGLSLVQELTKLHGGTVDVTSTLGQGTTFRVAVPLGTGHLPREQLVPEGKGLEHSVARSASAYVEEIRGWLGTAAGQEEGPPVPESVRATPLLPPMSARVLVVDDNADLRTYITGLLDASVTVETAEDGYAALQAIRAHPPDLVLSDVMMPRLGGFGLLRELRADPRLRAIPFVLLSARAGEEASVEGLEAGADDYLVKPFSARELAARVRTQLEMARVRREVAELSAREAVLQDAVRARDEFLSVVSHELKTPLAGFRLQLDLIERGLGPDVRARLGERLLFTRRQVHRLATVVETLLDMSQLSSGPVHLDVEDVDLSALVTEEVAQAREELCREGCEVTARVAGPVRGRFDKARLEQVVQGLLSNALKYGVGKPVEVHLEQVGPSARLTVVDHGMGVRPEDRERIWQRFERAVSVRNFGGLGLGLWIARQVVEAHGGSVGVSETPGGGATFTVSLPLDGPRP
ncbi:MULTISPECIES: hybrid sensor histidine kinase/response regulator [unclassified Corallococcus]|uniref:hybrid sensor histidine kinase/response regulator n=1 Tax=unclassified Corallococcus TaxID=2685029 RepID=UPI0022A96849|nr:MULTISPECIES: ATP-binding protein [unclassified Corallococcus]WAS88960.1 ATP-binding protein [Corallococcus sp. NCRR]